MFSKTFATLLTVGTVSISGGLLFNEGEENIHPANYKWNHLGALASYDYSRFLLISQ